MSRASVGSGLNTKLSAAVTSPGYLVQIGFSTIVRWSSRGTVTWNSQTWTARDFKVAGNPLDKLTLQFTNHDDLLGGLLLNQDIANRAIRVWSFEGDAPGATDVVELMTDGVGDTYSLTTQTAVIQAMQRGKDVIKEPAIRIVRNAVRQQLTAVGEVIYWNGEYYTVTN